MSDHTYLKFLTEEFVKYLNSSKEERKKKREAKEGESIPLSRWFGVLPLSLRLFIRGK